MPEQDTIDRASLLYRWCKTDAAYLAFRTEQEAAKRADLHRLRLAVARDALHGEADVPQLPRSVPPAQPVDKKQLLLATLEGVAEWAPGRLREILAPVILDIIEEYQSGD